MIICSIGRGSTYKKTEYFNFSDFTDAINVKKKEHI